VTKTKWYTKLIYTVVSVALVLSFGLVAAPASPVKAATSTWYVDASVIAGGDGTTPATTGDHRAFKTISAGVDAASAGNTVSVAAGTYDATNGESFPLNVDVDYLTIISSGTAATTLITPTSADYAAFNVTAAGATIGGSGFTITAGGRGGIYADATGGNGITVQDCIFKSYSADQSRGMWFENLSNGALITDNSFATPRLGTGIQIVNADGATISNNIVAAGTVKYCFLTFKAEAFYPVRNAGTPYAEYVATSPSTIDDVLVTGNSVTGHATNGPRWGIRFAASTKHSDHGNPQAQDLTVGTGSPGVSITGNTFTNNSEFGVLIDANAAAPDDGAQIAHITGVANILINNNDFSGNTVAAVKNGQTDEGNVNAESNWWNAASGPSTVGLGSGDPVTTYVDYTPWLCKSYATGGTDITVAMNKNFYKTGVSPVVTVNDCSKSGIVGVFAYSDTTGYTGKIQIALNETGSSTGIFTGTFKLVNTTPSTGELLVNDDDIVTVRYYNGSAYIEDTAEVDDTAPTITVVSPAAGSKTTNTQPPIEASYVDASSSGIDTTTVVMKLDGVAVTPQTKTTTHVVYTPPTAISQGSHTVTVDVSDVAGNAATQKSWSFTVDNVKPVISLQVATPAVVKPAASGGVTPIVFTAHVVDATSGVATVTINCSSLHPAGGAALTMYDDGTHGDVTPSDGTYTLNYVNNLTTEGNYTLPVNSTDNAGNAAIAKDIALGVWTDTTPPVITSPAITYPFALASARHGDTVTISATVTDDSGTVTGVNATCAGLVSSPVTLTKGTGDTWSVTATVASTTTQIDIMAWDAKNNTSHDTSLSLVVDPDITGKVINLSPGWNFISLPLIPGVPTIEDPAITSVLSGVGNIAHVTRVDYYFNTGTSTGWQSYVPGSGGLLATMDDGNGYWMWMNAADTLTVKGRIMPPAPAVPPTYPVYAGWNAIGFKSLADMANGTYLGGVTPTVLWGYDATTGYFRVCPSPQTHGSATPGNMEVGYGYWAWVTASGTIVPP